MTPDRPWQGTIVEAPDMVLVGGAYWLVYSANWYNSPDYAIGAARCAGPAGPCADTGPTPLLASNFQGLGPGEASVFHDAAGIWMLYSPRRSLAPKPDVPPRPVFITRLGFTTQGPYLAGGPLPRNRRPARHPALVADALMLRGRRPNPVPRDRVSPAGGPARRPRPSRWPGPWWPSSPGR